MVWHLLQIGHIKAKESRVSCQGFTGFTSESLKQVSNGNLFLLSVCDYVYIYNTISIEGNRLSAIWHSYLLISVYAHASPNNFLHLNHFFTYTHFFAGNNSSKWFCNTTLGNCMWKLKCSCSYFHFVHTKHVCFSTGKKLPFVRIAHSHSLLQLRYWDS